MTDVHKRVCGNEPKLRRASRTSRRIRTCACRCELSDDVLCNIPTPCEREPQRRKLMKLDARVLGRAVRIDEQPVDAAAPLAAVEVHLAGETLDLVAAACVVSGP